ncbi:hypothetical protein [Rhizobium sp. MHM7A]|uniref:hypothetical protein n=1 Tax=Rhizobium sp. MHM7A TaxID=2583233 RepID=UPI00110651D5|nr:hypothetical protein [Rhizobium sp. MHM7A]TLX16073.1 hypothetical protein FFR93_01765 [Rhizobium sp. MHM7A]
MRNFEAGFDVTCIAGAEWSRLMAKYGLTRVDDHEDGWAWIGESGIVVTSCDPISGVFHDRERDERPDYASYIGISGSAEFVAGLFVDIKEVAEDIKGENFGSRSFI